MDSDGDVRAISSSKCFYKEQSPSPSPPRSITTAEEVDQGRDDSDCSTTLNEEENSVQENSSNSSSGSASEVSDGDDLDSEETDKESDIGMSLLSDHHNSIGSQISVSGYPWYYRAKPGSLNIRQLLSLLESCEEEDSTKKCKKLPRDFPFDGKRVGTYTCLVDQSAFVDCQDVSFDRFRPWNKDGITSTKTGLQKSGGQLIYYSRSTHPKCLTFERKIRFISDEKKSILSAVAYEYTVGEPGVELLSLESASRRPLPSSMKRVRNALHFRTPKAAANALEDEGIIMGTQQIQNAARIHPTAIKSRKGKAPETDYDEISNLKLLATHKAQHRCVVGKNSEEIRSIFVFEDALKLFLNDCPNIEQLEQFRENLSGKTEDEILQLYNNLLTESNESQFLNQISSAMFYDSTFSLGEQLVTPVLGIISSFRSKSYKCLPMLLGVMLHFHKHEDNHHAFGLEFAKCAAKLKLDKKRPSCFVTDGENALRGFLNNPYFDSTRHICCDFHLKGNLKIRFKENTDYFFRLLFGKKDGENDVFPGLLSCFTEEKFFCRLAKMEKKVPLLFEWVKTRDKNLFNLHSCRAKLECGFMGHLLTTNSIECFNKELKNIITGHATGPEIVKKMWTYVKDQIKECDNCLFVQSEKVRLPPHSSCTNYSSLNESQRNQLRKTKGLPTTMDTCEEFKALAELTSCKELTLKERLQLFEKLKSITVDSIINNHYVNEVSLKRVTKVVESVNGLECQAGKCQEKTTICVHCAAVFNSFSNEKKKEFIKMGEHFIIGKKHDAKFKSTFHASKSRKGTAFSKNNFVRITTSIMKKGFLDTPDGKTASSEKDDDAEVDDIGPGPSTRADAPVKRAAKRLFADLEKEAVPKATPKSMKGRPLVEPKFFSPL